MATLVATPKEIAIALTYQEGEPFNTYFKRSERKLAELHQKAHQLPNGQIVGGVISFPIADGSAMYLVVSDKPLKLAHLPYGDAWHIEAPTIRGLRRVDVVQMLQREKTLASMYSGRNTEATHG